MSIWEQWFPHGHRSAKKKNGFVLALGGGGGRGLAHLGVFDVLEQHDLVPDAIIGTSIGALFGAMYAMGNSAASIQEQALEYLQSEPFHRLELPVIEEADHPDESWLSRFVSAARQTVMYTKAATDMAFADVQVLYEVAELFTGGKDFSAVKIPLFITAVQFPCGECRVFSQQHGVALSRAIAASMAIPGVFEPVRIADEKYMDGGLASEIPAREASMLASEEQLVVAVNVGSRPLDDYEPANVYGMLDWSSQIKSLYLRRYEKQHADILIEPLVAYTQWHDFSRPKEEIEKGRQATLEIMPQLLAALQRT